MDRSLSVGLCNIYKQILVFGLIEVSNPMSKCGVSETGTLAKMKNPGN